jgi:hypothetical protein
MRLIPVEPVAIASLSYTLIVLMPQRRAAGKGIIR